MKKNTSAVNIPLTDEHIDQFCLSIEQLLNNIKSKSSKAPRKDYMLDPVMFDELTND